MIIFERNISCKVEQQDDNMATVTVAMCDNYHDIAVSFLVELPEGKILDARAVINRAPDAMCKETEARMLQLKGVILGKGIRKNALEILGGATGCIHLMELVIEAAEALVQGNVTIRCQSLGSFEALKDDLSGKLAGKCYFHTENAKRIAQNNRINKPSKKAKVKN